MRLTALIWNRYRSFKERQRVELAALTIIIGRNGSGKSVISRLPLILASGLSSEALSPIDLMAGGIEHAAQYQDLVNMRGALPFSLGCEIEVGTDRFEFETTLRHLNETRALVVEKFRLSKNGQDTLELELSAVEELTEPKPTYKRRFSGVELDARPLLFKGLFPDAGSFEGQTREFVETVRRNFQDCLSAPSYLGPFRAEPDVSTRSPGQDIYSLGTKGERSTEFLADDKLRHSGRVCTNVSEWFSRSLGQGISVDTNSIRPQLVITDQSSGVEVSLADTGAGLSQSLPIVVQNYGYRAGRLRSPLLIVEQPELHLHPGAHGDLADLIIGTSLDGKGYTAATCIVETHSEQFLMRARRRIAEGLPKDHISLWSLNHRDTKDQEVDPLRVIRFDQAGDPDAWPYGVFEEALEDLSKMRTAARARPHES